MFKVEWRGDGFVGLSAKTYYCFDHNDSSNDKYSSKGVSRAFKLTREHYLDVLKTKKSSIQVNKGFIMKYNQIYTYEMKKSGLSYFYCKRKLLDDGISTTYLDI